MSCDPNFANTVLLLHLDGSNGQTTTVDSSSYAWPATMNASIGVALSTTQAKFGATSFHIPAYAPFNYTTQPLNIPFVANDALDIFTDYEWTIEGWVNPTSNPSGGTIQSQALFLVNYGSAPTGGGLGLQISLAPSGDGANMNLVLQDNLFHAPADQYKNTGPNNPVTPGTWHHIAVVLHSGTLTAYFDGVSQFTDTSFSPTNYTTQTNPNVLVGSGATGFTGPTLDGYVDEVRVSNMARYTANFTPSSSAFPSVACSTTPDTTNTSLVAANAAIVAAGLVLGTITCQTSSTVPIGYVISQSPAGGTQEPAGTAVNLTVYCLGNAYLGAKFVAANVGKAIMTANPGNINPRITPPERDTTVRIDPSWRSS